MKKEGSGRIPGFRLILITDVKQTEDELKYFIQKCCSYGIKAIQLRRKDLSANRLLKLAVSLKKITKQFSAKLLVNDRLDIALLSKADGLHSPENGIDAENVRRFNSKILIGKSVHSIETAKQAEAGNYDYLIFGTVFKTSSKIQYGNPQGLKKLNEICKAVHIPVFAVGGITPKRAKQCVQNGAYGAAVIGSLSKSNDLKKTIQEFSKALRTL